MNRRHARWAFNLAEIDFSFKLLLGIKNSRAVALNHHTDDLIADVMVKTPRDLIISI